MNPELTLLADDFILAYSVHLIFFTYHGSPYDVLGVSDVEASFVVIKRRYRRMALFLHPDKNASVASESAFNIVSQASDVLSDEAKRWNYDYDNGFRSSVAKQTPQNPFKRAVASFFSPSKQRAAAAPDDRQQPGAEKQRTKPSSCSHNNNNPSSNSSSVSTILKSCSFSCWLWKLLLGLASLLPSKDIPGQGKDLSQ